MRCNLYLYDGNCLIVTRCLDARPTDSEIRDIMHMRGATSAKLMDATSTTTLATF